MLMIMILILLITTKAFYSSLGAERYDNVVDQGGGKAGKLRPNNSMTR